jgi:hypothetical protein
VTLHVVEKVMTPEGVRQVHNLIHLVSHGIDPDDVGLIKKLAMGSGCCCT